MTFRLVSYEDEINGVIDTMQYLSVSSFGRIRIGLASLAWVECWYFRCVLSVSVPFENARFKMEVPSSALTDRER